MGLVSGFDYTSNFWQSNAQLRITAEFKMIYDRDSSRNKEKSSKLMWSIALIYDPDSKYAKLSENERIEIIESDFLGEKFNKSELNDAINLYIKLNTTQLQRSAINLDRKLQERDDFINNTVYSEETAQMLDKMIVDSDKIFTLRNKIQEELLKEKSITGSTREGTTESASERGEI